MTKGLKKVDVIEVEQDYYAHVIMLINHVSNYMTSKKTESKKGNRDTIEDFGNILIAKFQKYLHELTSIGTVGPEKAELRSFLINKKTVDAWNIIRNDLFNDKYPKYRAPTVGKKRTSKDLGISNLKEEIRKHFKKVPTKEEYIRKASIPYTPIKSAGGATPFNKLLSKFRGGNPLLSPSVSGKSPINPQQQVQLNNTARREIERELAEAREALFTGHGGNIDTIHLNRERNQQNITNLKKQVADQSRVIRDMSIAMDNILKFAQKQNNRQEEANVRSQEHMKISKKTAMLVENMDERDMNSGNLTWSQLLNYEASLIDQHGICKYLLLHSWKRGFKVTNWVFWKSVKIIPECMIEARDFVLYDNKLIYAVRVTVGLLAIAGSFYSVVQVGKVPYLGAPVRGILYTMSYISSKMWENIIGVSTFGVEKGGSLAYEVGNKNLICARDKISWTIQGKMLEATKGWCEKAGFGAAVFSSCRSLVTDEMQHENIGVQLEECKLGVNLDVLFRENNANSTKGIKSVNRNNKTATKSVNRNNKTATKSASRNNKTPTKSVNRNNKTATKSASHNMNGIKSPVPVKFSGWTGNINVHKPPPRCVGERCSVSGNGKRNGNSFIKSAMKLLFRT